MNGWEIAVIIWLALELLVSVGMHDKPKVGKHNMLSGFIHVGIWLVFLTKGGFFK